MLMAYEFWISDYFILITWALFVLIVFLLDKLQLFTPWSFLLRARTAQLAEGFHKLFDDWQFFPSANVLFDETQSFFFNLELLVALGEAFLPCSRFLSSLYFIELYLHQHFFDVLFFDLCGVTIDKNCMSARIEISLVEDFLLCADF